MSQVHVAIVGGGISGLAAAYRLRQLLGPAATLTLVEQRAVLGGTVRTANLAGRPYDVGAEAFLARRPEVMALVAELGLAESLTHPTAARASIRAGGRCRPIPTGTVLGVPSAPDAVAEVLSDDGLRRVAGEPRLAPLRLPDTDIAVGGLLRDRLGPEVVDRLVDPLLGGVYAGRADLLGLRATMPALAAALDAGAGSLLAATAGLLPKAASATPPPPVFGTLIGGLGTLIDRLAAKADLRIRCGLPVRALHRLADGWRLAIGAAPSPEYLDADAVVLAVPPPAARRLLDDVAPAACAAFSRIELASVAVIALALPANAAIPDSSGVLLASGERRGDGTAFTAKAFTFSSRKWAHLADGQHILVRGSVGRYGETEVLHRTDAELIAAVGADLAELTGVTAEPLDALVARWGGGLPQYGIGHLDVVAEIERSVARAPSLAVAGAALRGVGLPGCVASGQAAAERIAAGLRR